MWLLSVELLPNGMCQVYFDSLSHVARTCSGLSGNVCCVQSAAWA